MTKKVIKPAADSSTQSEISGDPDPDSAMARASRIQAATSLTAAADMANRPISVVSNLSSARIRARTGKAVMESATPMKTRRGPVRASLMIVERITNEVPMPRIKGREMPARAIASAFFPVRRTARKSSSRPTRKRKKMRPMLATVSSTVRLLFGNTELRNLVLRPSADGPSRIPPCILGYWWKADLLHQKFIFLGD